MIENKNKTIKYCILTILMLVILAISVILILPNFNISSIETMTQKAAQKLETDLDEIQTELVDIAFVNGSDGDIEVYKTHLTGIADVSGKVLFCVEHGQKFWPHRDETQPSISVDTAKIYGYLSSPTEKYWGRKHDECWPCRHDKERTYPYLICTNNHYNLVQNGSNYMPDAGYIVTYQDMEEVTEEKQAALWATGINFGKDSKSVNRDGTTDLEKYGGTEIYNEALHYKEFHDQITEDGKNYSEPDIKVEDRTDSNKITVKANNKEQTLTIGPLSIDYIYGAYDNVAFGGISDMYMVGYNSKGDVVKGRIEILKYVDPIGIAYEPKYFKPNQQDDSFVDYLEQVYPKGQSAGEETFQLMINNPNADLGKDAKEDEYVSSVKIHVEFKWMGVTSAKVCEMEGYYYDVNWRHPHKRHCCCNDPDCNGRCCYYCYGYSWLTATKIQDHIQLLTGERKLFSKEIELNTGMIPLNITMDLGGKVWEDVPAGKEYIADGKYGNNDKVIPNVKVTLYTEDGDIATLLSNASEEKISDEEIMSRVNPTYTDKNGDYLFKGLDPLKKYYVTFEYNGQIYLPTDYNLNISDYNTDAWKITSKGTETPSDRKGYDENFAEICSSPVNYPVPDQDKVLNSSSLTKKGGKYYNEAFSQYELMGFELNKDGNYELGVRLIDSFYTIDEDRRSETYGEIIETNELQSGEISDAIRKFILENKKSPTYKDMLNIYNYIAGNNDTLWRKLQFIEDCKIQSYTQAQGEEHDLYPVYDNIVINRTIDMKYNTAEEARNQFENKDTSTELIDGLFYNPIYPGQFFVNQGLWRRQEADLALRKDIAYAATRINGKTEVYTYDKRSQMTDEEREELARLRAIYEKDRTNLDNYQAYVKYAEKIEGKYYWEIQLRMRDYNNYYASAYTREIYPADYSYRSSATNKSGKDLELYVTYKITVRNSSTSIVSEIKEIVDYYDKDYTYMNNLSWIMYKKNSNGDNSEISLSEDEYFNAIDKLSLKDLQDNNKAKSINSSYSDKENSNGTYTGTSRYGSVSQQDMEEEYNSVYIRGLDSKKLASGEEAYVYLTFKVNENSQGIILDDGTHDNDETLKQNYAEINGYTTYYKDGTELPNGIIIKGEGKPAGLIDIDSNPGNLCLEDLKEDRYEKNFEDDTDRAKSIKVTILDNGRSINGTVWEDKRTQTVSNSVIGDGVRNLDKDGKELEIGINGITVELVEKLENGNEYLWQTTTTKTVTLKDADGNEIKKDGYYEFKTDENNNVYIIPGNYFIRFHYGNTDATVLTNNNGGSNMVSYNGQDFKSTVYQKNMNVIDDKKDEIKDNPTQDTNKENYEKETYYDIKASDAFGSNLSDAKDLWKNEKRTINWEEITLSGRQEVNSYSNNNGNGVTNHLAEVLASPYASTINSELIKELRENTNMTAETGIIVLEGEYNRTKTDGYNNNSNGSEIYLYGNDLNGKYTLNNVDFGLTERPKAQLELSKKVTNVKVTLANGNTLFDATKSATDINWAANKAYNLISKMSGNKYQEYYGQGNRYAYRTEVDTLVASKYDASHNNGLIKLDMDNELMHRATIRITYALTVTNAGETSYTGQDFYYKGTGTSEVVTTTANVVLDYVANNLQFRAEDNTDGGWTTVNDVVNTEGLNDSLSDATKKYNTIIDTKKLAIPLKPGETTTPVSLVLTQSMTAQNTADDRTYNNIAEITTISNSVGRRMAYSIQGNQDPTAEEPTEVDSVKSEEVIVIPPTGIGEIVTYIALAIGVLVILTTGIIFIKKKVLKK